MDLIVDLIRATRTGPVIFHQSWYRGAWGVSMPGARHAGFHVIVAGRMWLECPPLPPRWLNAGDLVLLSGGAPHTLSAAPGTPVVPFPEYPFGPHNTGPEPGWRPAGTPVAHDEASMLCGAFCFDSDRAHPVFEALPPLLHIDAAARDRDPSLNGIVALLAAEVKAGERPGRAALTESLVEALFFYMLRYAQEHEPEVAGWLRALRDPGLSRALSLVHRQPEHPWTLDELARRSGMSRATLARRFTEVVGQPVMAWVAQQRLERARTLLQSTSLGLDDIAGRVGYANAFSFSRAFARHTGVAPGQWRGLTGAQVLSDSARPESVAL